MKERYIDLMELALSAYTEKHIDEYFERVQREGLTEHGFARLTANIGILLAHGRRSDLLDRFLPMMDFCCAGVTRYKAANDFSVRELIACIWELERTDVVPSERIEVWKDGLREIEPTKVYTVYAKKEDDPVRNWALFTAVSEFYRTKAGLGDTTDFIEVQLASQLQWLDENGMYCDHSGTEVHQPMVYDLVPRGLFAVLLCAGYRGRYYEEIDEVIRKAALCTLRMQSTTGELAFGGRSNQFLHNEGWLATVFEFEAARYQREGNGTLATEFKNAALRAAAASFRYFAQKPIRHVKNRFPTETKYGCEKYAYFDKYMITAASFFYTAYTVADDTVQGTEAPDLAPSVFRTSEHFHKVFLKSGGYALEFDTNADPHYDASGLGRLHRADAPSAICIAAPCPRDPSYRLDLEGRVPLSIAPAVRDGGEWIFGADERVVHEIAELSEDGEAAYAAHICRFPSGACVTVRYTVTASGITAEVTGNGEVALTLPAFTFDGESHSTVACEGDALTVSYGGWQCHYRTDGRIGDSGKVAANRNGYYRAFLASSSDRLSVTVMIERADVG